MSSSLRRESGARPHSLRARRPSGPRPRALRRIALLACAAVGACLIPAAAASACESIRPSAETAARHARAIRCEVNRVRAGHGLGALRNDGALARAARRFSSAMVRQGFFDHVSPSGSTLADRVRRAGFRAGRSFGETIGWGSGAQGTPAAIVAAWMNSPPHRAIVLDGRFSVVGLGVVPGSPVGVGGAATVTANFAG